MKKFLFFYFLFLIFTFALLTSGVIDSQDGFQYFSVARNIYYTHEITAPPDEYTGGIGVGKNIPMSTQIGRDGKTYSSTGLGYSLAFLPAVFITDLVYKHYNLPPPVHFPLEADWLIFMLGSMTNVFFAALLGVVLYLYFVDLGLNKKQALLLDLVALFSTNLLAYAKHSYAHMMFVSFLMLSFYLLRRSVLSKRKILLLFSGISYGVVAIAYNLTFALPLIPLIVYYFLLTKHRFDKIFLKESLIRAAIFLIGFTPFLLIYNWQQYIITPAYVHTTGTAVITSYARGLLPGVPFSNLFEGVFGELFSPGRSIFLYSPILLIILIFWSKIKSSVLPELWVLILMFLIYIPFYGLQASYEPGTGYIGYWSGELSWGPRYLLPLVPFGMLIVGHIYQFLSKRTKAFIFTPLVIFGLYVGSIGTLVPYQNKLHNLQQDVYFAGAHYTSFLYMDLLPKFSPLLSISREANLMINNFPKTLNHGPYNLRFYDGFDFPFQAGHERWRTIDNTAYLSFDNYQKDPVKDLSMVVINHPIDTSSSASANLSFTLNNQSLDVKPQIKVGKREVINIPLDPALLKKTDNDLEVSVVFSSSEVVRHHAQIAALLGFSINDKPQSLETFDFPYISALGPKTNGIKYKNYGGTNSNPWQSWLIHTQIFERVPDFWWIKSLFYWDIPKRLFLYLFLINIISIFAFGFLTFKFFKKLNAKNS